MRGAEQREMGEAVAAELRTYPGPRPSMYSATYSRLRVYRPQVNTSEREYPGTRVEVNCGRPPGWVALGSRDRECSDGSISKWVRRNSLTLRPLHQDVISFVARSLRMSVRPLAHSDDPRLSTEPSGVTSIRHEILLSPDSEVFTLRLQHPVSSQNPCVFPKPAESHPRGCPQLL
jgi:hypothetical protein